MANVMVYMFYLTWYLTIFRSFSRSVFSEQLCWMQPEDAETAVENGTDISV